MPEFLYRRGVQSPHDDALELRGAPSHTFKFYRTELTLGSLVFPRYYLWPYPREVLTDILNMGCHPINGFRGTAWVRDISDWYEVISEFTFQTISWRDYSRITSLSDSWAGPVVMKTREKSFKEQWSTSMFAKDPTAAREVFANIVSKGIDPEDIFVREFVPLVSTSEVIEGTCPESEEYRFFILHDKVLCASSYWPNSELDPVNVPPDFIRSVIEKIREGGPSDLKFYVLDIAKTAKGSWVVVEINDGCSSGLCNIDPKTFYSRILELES